MLGGECPKMAGSASEASRRQPTLPCSGCSRRASTSRAYAFRPSPSLADAILDRLVHNAHRIELKGESMRRITARRAVTTETLDARQPS